MAVIQGSASGNGLEVDADHNGRVNPRPPAFGALGYYREAVVSGAVAATLAANSTLFSFRWGDATRLALVQSVRIGAIVSGTITTGVLFDLALLKATGFTASDTGGTSVAPGSGQKLRTSMGSSLVTDVRVAATATLTPGTRILDAQAHGRVQGFTGTALGTQLFGSSVGPVPLYVRDNNDHHPLILTQNEGFVIQNPLAGPATGTITLLVQLEWGEVSSF